MASEFLSTKDLKRNLYAEMEQMESNKTNTMENLNPKKKRKQSDDNTTLHLQ